MINPDRALDYLAFVVNRHLIWEARLEGLPQEEWAYDPILQTRKFTNVFRILDPGTQYVLTSLAEPDAKPEDVLLRLFLYRHTGRVEAWEYLEMTSGLPDRTNLPDVLAAFKQYRGKGSVTERPVFTGAYLVFPQSAERGTDKLESIVDLTKRLFVEGTVAQEFLDAGSQADRFAALRSNKGVADFMSMQVLTDWGYTSHCGEDRENEFVVLGPGARRGATALDPAGKPEDTLEWAYREVQDQVTLDLPNGMSRPPSRMDVQNTLCEFSKYVRHQSKPPGKPYTPAHPGPQDPPVLPEHWTK